MLRYLTGLINSISLRGKFLVAPVIALVTMAFISYLFLLTLEQQKAGLDHIENEDLVIIGQLSGVSARISHIHSRAFDVLRAASEGADEERVYELGKPLIEHLVGIEELLVSRLLKDAWGRDGQDLYVPIESNFLEYKIAIIAALEMSTIDIAMAEKEMDAADEVFSLLVIDLQEGLKDIGLDIAFDLEYFYDEINTSTQLMIKVFLAAILGTFIISLFLSKRFTHDLGQLIEAIEKLSLGEKICSIPDLSSGKELNALANGLQVFQQSLVKIDEQRADLEDNNNKLLLEIDERQKTEADLLETRARFQFTLDNNPTMIYAARPSGDGLKVDFVSENSRKVIGHEAISLLGDRRLWMGRLEIENGSFLSREMADLHAKRNIVRDYLMRTENGTPIWVQDSLTMKVGADGGFEILGSMTNISDIKAAEEKLQTMNVELLDLAASLEEKVKDRTADLEKLNKDLERLSEAKSEFVSIVSHDLRTPLTSIKLFSDIMLDGMDDLDRESQEEYLSIISAETDRLSRLISNVLDFQKISAGKMQWNDAFVDISEVIAECVRPFNISAEAKGLVFSCEFDAEPIETVIDGDRLAQVVYNLLSNSMKFTEEGSIKVSLHKMQSVDGDRFRLSVSDTGPGMAAEQLENIFEPFEQIQGAPMMGKGTGLGLYITNCVVDRYHGRAWAESVVGEGATFFIEMPVREPESYVI